MERRSRFIVGISMVAVVAAVGVQPAQGQSASGRTSHAEMAPAHHPYRDYLTSSGATGAVCQLPAAKRTGHWVCPVERRSSSTSSPSSGVPLPVPTYVSSSASPNAAPYPIVVSRNGTWVQSANWSEEYDVEGFAYGYNGEIAGYGTWDTVDNISGYAIQNKSSQVRFSTAVVNAAFTAERITTDKSQSGIPISGTYQDSVVSSIPANTTKNNPINPKYDNSAKTIFVAHEITWEMSGIPGRWYAYMYTFLMHNTSISGTGKYLYDIGGALPPNPEGGEFTR